MPDNNFIGTKFCWNYHIKQIFYRMLHVKNSSLCTIAEVIIAFNKHDGLDESK